MERQSNWPRAKSDQDHSSQRRRAIMNTEIGQDDGSYRARQLMIQEQIKARGISDPRVLAAMAAIPREQFIPPQDAKLAYEDRALAIEEHQTISQPYIVAYMTQALELEQSHKVLEVGTGSGYQTAILAKLTDRLHTIERLESLSERAAGRLASLGITGVNFHLGDGSLGWPECAPYDRIMVTAGAPSVPGALLDQLVDEGMMIIPVGNAAQQTLVSLTKHADRTSERSLIPCRFVKLVGRQAWR